MIVRIFVLHHHHHHHHRRRRRRRRRRRHQIGNMDRKPLFMVMSWNNGTPCTPLSIFPHRVSRWYVVTFLLLVNIANIWTIRGFMDKTILDSNSDTCDQVHRTTGTLWSEARNEYSLSTYRSIISTVMNCDIFVCNIELIACYWYQKKLGNGWFGCMQTMFLLRY